MAEPDDTGWSEAGAAWLETLSDEEFEGLTYILENGIDEEHEELREQLHESYLEATGGYDGIEASLEDDDDDQPDDDEDEGDSLSVWDAADIYFDSGFDEDRMFGYSHEELTDAHESGG